MSRGKEVHDYYNKLALAYDEDRFSNSYGKFIHEQEVRLLSKYARKPSKKILDLGCGTGRLTSFATDGLDFSENMLQVAQSKYPQKQFHLGNAQNIPLEENTFDGVFCFHVFMHLTEEEIEKAIKEVARVLKPNGIFLFDIPSEARRKLLGKKVNGWHGATSLSTMEIKQIVKYEWDFLGYEGIMLLPVHLIPSSIRKNIVGLDSVLNQTFLKKWASYHLVCLKKK